MPGGGIEPTELAAVAAAREANEEAGVSGNIGRCIGTFEVSVGIILSVRLLASVHAM